MGCTISVFHLSHLSFYLLFTFIHQRIFGAWSNQLKEMRQTSDKYENLPKPQIGFIGMRVSVRVTATFAKKI